LFVIETHTETRKTVKCKLYPSKLKYYLFIYRFDVYKVVFYKSAHRRSINFLFRTDML